jgi:hypothetical protein
VRVALGKFAAMGVGLDLGSDLGAITRSALTEFSARLQSGPVPISIPRFLKELAPGDPETVVEVTVDDEVWSVFEAEASRQGTTVSQLANHSVLLYMAEADRRSAA